MRLLLAPVVVASFLVPSALAAPPDPDSEDGQIMAPHRAWIEDQHASDGQYCCNLSDGRPAELRKLDGHYEVFYSSEHWADGTNEWIRVPDKALLPQSSPLFVPIAWIINGHVFCVALPSAS